MGNYSKAKVTSLAKENERKGTSYRQNFLMTLVMNLSRTWKSPPPTLFQGDTLPRPASVNLKFLTPVDYSRLSYPDLKIKVHRPLRAPPRFCPGKPPNPQLWALNTSHHSQGP